MAIITFIVTYWLFTFWCIIGIWKTLSKSTKGSQRITTGEICIIVPFRNEEHRILPLLNACKTSLPPDVQCIFVDDHSTDQSATLIQQYLPSAEITINQGSGKKKAIETGILLTERKYILTWDADIIFNSEYWKAMVELEDADMHILPVQFDGNLIQKFTQLDTELTQIINYAQSGWSQPIIASGANFLFKRSSYLSFAQTDHFALASGDDQFLLRDFKRNSAEIQLQTHTALAVITPCESDLKTFFRQRLRWLSKTPHTKDIATNTLAIIPFILTITWLALQLYYVIHKDYLSIGILYCSKLFMDFIICLRYFSNKKELNQLLMLPVLEFYFPIYCLSIGILSLFLKPTWKNRPIR